MDKQQLRKCSCCSSEILLEYFSINRKGEYFKTCNKCRKKAREKRKLYRCPHNRQKSECKECGGNSICEHQKIKWRCKECNGNSICEHQRIRSKCRECNPEGHLASLVRSRVFKALKKEKSKSSLEYLGTDISFFRKYIEDQFQEGMSWDNYGCDWHIDHIIPLMYCDPNPPTIEEVAERLHYTNTQPLWAVDNISKGNRFVG